MNERFHLLYEAKKWLEGFAGKPYALWVLSAVAFIEASVFPLPPDILFVALSVASPRRSFVHAGACIAGSVAGAFLGYFIGEELFEVLGRHLVDWLGMGGQFATVLAHYRDHAWTALILAGFTNIPFFVFTIAAGFNRTLDLVTLGLASLAGRTLRFSLLAIVFYFFGPAVKRYIDRYLPAISLGMVAAFILVMMVLKWFL